MSVALGSEVRLRFALVTHGTEDPAPVGSFTFSFYDLNGGVDGTRERLSVGSPFAAVEYGRGVAWNSQLGARSCLRMRPRAIRAYGFVLSSYCSPHVRQARPRSSRRAMSLRFRLTLTGFYLTSRTACSASRFTRARGSR